MRGIVSSGLIEMVNGKFQCDTKNFQIFTEIAEFSNWIETVVTKNAKNIPELIDTKSVNSNHQCGRPSLRSGLVIGGQDTKRGHWPFLAALYNLRDRKFFCGGSLITQQHVLTGKKEIINYFLN